jgi:hypothetical protein
LVAAFYSFHPLFFAADDGIVVVEVRREASYADVVSAESKEGPHDHR